MRFYSYVVQQTPCFKCKCCEVTEMRRTCRWPGTWNIVHLDRDQNKQRVWHIFCNSSYCFTGKQTTVKKKKKRIKKSKTIMVQKSQGTKQHQGSVAAVMWQDCRVRQYLRRHRGNLTAMTPDALLVSYIFVSQLQGRKVYFWIRQGLW